MLYKYKSNDFLSSIIYSTLIITLFLLFSCAEKEVEDSRYFKINGTFEHIDEGQTVSLFLKKPDENVLIDSVKCDKDGKFSLKGINNYKEFYILKTRAADYNIILLLDTCEKITITADVINLLSSYNIEGSHDCKIIQNLEQRLYKTTSTIDSISNIFKKYYQTNKIDSIKPSLDSIFYLTTLAQKKYSDNFITNYKSSLASLIAVSQYIMPQKPIYDREKDAQTFFKINNALRKKYPQSLHVLQMNNFCEKLKKDIEDQNLASNELTIGMQAPPIVSRDKRGAIISLDSLEGRYVLISFWASWSKPSRDVNFNLSRYYWRYYHKFDVLQISLDIDKKMWLDEIEKEQLYWYHACDFEQWNSKVIEDYKITSLPANFLIDPKGKIIAKNIFNDDLYSKLKEIFGIIRKVEKKEEE